MSLPACFMETKGMKLNTHGYIMFTEVRLVVHLITEEMIKAEKKNVKEFFTKYERALANLQRADYFRTLSPQQLLVEGDENFQLIYNDISEARFKRSYFNRQRGAEGVGPGWRYPWLTLQADERRYRFQIEITGEFPKRERAFIELIKRLFGDKLIMESEEFEAKTKT